MVDFICQNWYLIVIAVAAIVVIVKFGMDFFAKPTKEQLAQVREWLLIAVVEAEKALGSGTGQLKLRYVYDKFLSKFPYVSGLVSFEFFSNLVDEALEKLEAMLDTNEKVKNYIEEK